MRESRIISSDPRIASGGIDASMRAFLLDAMARHDYGLAGAGTSSGTPAGGVAADLGVGYLVALEKDVDLEVVSRFLGGSTDEAVPENGLERGMLILEVVDARSHRIAWHGSVQANIDLDLPEDERRERLRLAVDMLVDDMMAGR